MHLIKLTNSPYFCFFFNQLWFFFIYLVDKMPGEIIDAKFFSSNKCSSCQCKECSHRHNILLIVLMNWQILLKNW